MISAFVLATSIFRIDISSLVARTSFLWAVVIIFCFVSKITKNIRKFIHTALGTMLRSTFVSALFTLAIFPAHAQDYTNPKTVADSAFLSLISKSIKHGERNEHDMTRNSCIEALPWAAKSTQKDAVAWCYNNIGCSYLSEGNYDKASENFYIALNELNKIPPEPSHTSANIYNNLGIVNIKLNQLGKALAYYNKAEDIAKNGNLYFQLAQAYENKGDYYNLVHQPDSAKHYFKQEMEIGKKTGKIDLQAMANVKLGETFIESGQFGSAIPHLQKAITLALAGEHFDYIVIEATYSLADTRYRMKKYTEAEEILQSVIKDASTHNMKDYLLKGYSKLAEVYKATGQYKKEAETLDSLAVVKDSLTSTEKTKAINLMEIKYKTAEKDKQLAQNQLLIAQQKNKITQKNIWMASIMSGILLLAFIGTAFYNRSQHKQKLQAEQIKTLQQENTIGILKGVVQGEENERSRIARELHDGIGGMLSAAMMGFSTIRHENKDITTLPAFNKAMNLLDEMGDEIRKTSHNLMPEILAKQDLSEALRTYCNQIQDGKDLKIEFQSLGDFSDLKEDVKLNIYRIVQELLKNITQHAHATSALVQLMMHKRNLTVTVEDNGTGFDKTKSTSGIGLRNLQTRVKSLGGTFTLESEIGKGTSVYLEFEV